MLSGAGRAVTYTAFNMVATITQGASTYSWTYDDQHRRIHGQSRFYINDPGTGALSEMVGGKQNKTWYDYVQAEGRIVAELPRVTPSGSAPGPFYFVTDSLGSIAVVTDSTGTVVERDAYDPWGKRRNPATGIDDPACGTAPPSVSSRGYTGHEHIDVVCLINENARVYDPAIGRFMSPDSEESDPYNPQNLNPYTYVDNRPLTLTDPTGHQPVEVVVVIGEAFEPILAPVAIGAGGGALIAGPAVAVFIVAVLIPFNSQHPHDTCEPGSPCAAYGRAHSHPDARGNVLHNDEAKPDDKNTGPKPQDLRKVPSHADADKVARDHGYKDAHDAKRDRGSSQVDIYIDKTTGEAYLWDGKNSSEPEPL
jgi:RHS repeat-associated protein